MGKPDPVLDQADRRSAAWLKLKAHLEGRLVKLRSLNDKDMDERKTARLRGTIRDVKYILSLGEDKPQVAIEDEFKD